MITRGESVIAHIKPLGGKAYGSIGHLPSSRLGPGDHHVTDGQARICTEKVRDKQDVVIVQGKMDGSCCAVALIDGALHPLTRKGHPALSSPYEQHHLFDRWVREREDRFRAVLREGERIVGEWLAQAHGTIYNLHHREPFAVFDLMTGSKRMTCGEFHDRVGGRFEFPPFLHRGGALPVEEALQRHRHNCWPCDSIEGVVYRVERNGKVDFLAKYVRPGKTDGCYLPSITGRPEVWNWRPEA